MVCDNQEEPGKKCLLNALRHRIWYLGWKQKALCDKKKEAAK